jgi:hypothetical protein
VRFGSSLVIPVNACMNAGGRATQDAKAEAGIQGLTGWFDKILALKIIKTRFIEYK